MASRRRSGSSRRPAPVAVGLVDYGERGRHLTPGVTRDHRSPLAIGTVFVLVPQQRAVYAMSLLRPHRLVALVQGGRPVGRVDRLGWQLGAVRRIRSAVVVFAFAFVKSLPMNERMCECLCSGLYPGPFAATTSPWMCPSPTPRIRVLAFGLKVELILVGQAWSARQLGDGRGTKCLAGRVEWPDLEVRPRVGGRDGCLEPGPGRAVDDH